MIVPFPPGGPVDVMARIVAQPLGADPRPAASSSRTAAAPRARSAPSSSPAAEPDGYTLLCGNISSLVVTPAVNHNRDYDPAKAFTPVAKLTQNYEVLVVHPDFPAKSVRELVAYAKANPGKLNYGSPGPGNASHLAAELFKLKTGIDIVHVPYKGAAEVATARDGRTGADVLRRHRRHVAADPRGPRSARWRCPARRAAPRCPTLPTMIESGVPDYVVLTYIGVVAPAAHPAAIVGKLNAAINDSLQTPEVVAAAAPAQRRDPSRPRRRSSARSLQASATSGREVVRLCRRQD